MITPDEVVLVEKIRAKGERSPESEVNVQFNLNFSLRFKSEARSVNFTVEDVEWGELSFTQSSRDAYLALSAPYFASGVNVRIA